MQAFELYGITRLSGRIFDLRKAGHNIVSIDCDVTNRYGEKCRVAELSGASKVYAEEGTGS